MVVCYKYFHSCGKRALLLLFFFPDARVFPVFCFFVFVFRLYFVCLKQHLVKLVATYWLIQVAGKPVQRFHFCLASHLSFRHKKIQFCL